LTKDDLAVLAERFNVISYKNVKKGGLDDLWRRTKVLAADNLLAAMFSAETIRTICRMLRRTTGVIVAPSDVFSSMSKLLNESASIELSSLKIALPEKRRSREKVHKEKVEREIVISTGSDEQPDRERTLPLGHLSEQPMEKAEGVTTEDEG